MRRRRILTAILLMILPASLAHSDVNWLHKADVAHSFVFSVDSNGGNFICPPENYFRDKQDTDRKAYSENQGEFDPFNSVAKGEILEFSDTAGAGELRMHTMAMGPDQDVDGNPTNPTNGLKVQACAQILPDSLDQNHCIDVTQQVMSWSTRWFTVDEPVTHEVMAELKGDLLFDEFGSDTDPYHATKVISADVTLDALVVSDTGEILSTKEVTSLQVTMEAPVSTTLTLSPTNSEGQQITYQLKGRISLEADVINFDWPTGTTTGGIDGTFNLGTPETPMALTAAVTKSPTGTPATGDSPTDDPGANEVPPGDLLSTEGGGGGGGGCFIAVASSHEK